MRELDVDRWGDDRPRPNPADLPATSVYARLTRVHERDRNPRIKGKQTVTRAEYDRGERP